MTAEGKLCITASSLKKTHPDKIVPMGPSYKLINQNIYLCPHSSTLPFLSFLKLIFSTWYFWVSEQILCHGYRPHSKVVESAPLDQMMTWSVISPEGPFDEVEWGLCREDFHKDLPARFILSATTEFTYGSGELLKLVYVYLYIMVLLFFNNTG